MIMIMGTLIVLLMRGKCIIMKFIFGHWYYFSSTSVSIFLSTSLFLHSFLCHSALICSCPELHAAIQGTNRAGSWQCWMVLRRAAVNSQVTQKAEEKMSKNICNLSLVRESVLERYKKSIWRLWEFYDSKRIHVKIKMSSNMILGATWQSIWSSLCWCSWCLKSFSLAGTLVQTLWSPTTTGKMQILTW